MRSVNLAEAKVGLSALLAAVEAGEGVVISRLRRFHAHQLGPAGSAMESSVPRSGVTQEEQPRRSRG
jgi:antitoxin (DNA-binding transcriptional repressor) of toxin-antitoxin stability system